MAVKAYIPMAKQMGVTKEKGVDAILMTLTVSGIKGYFCAFPAIRQFS